jgi:hypothetical protein
MSVFPRWQIICYLCVRLSGGPKLERQINMLITLTIIALVIALIFGKVTTKEIKEYVRKHTEGRGKGCPGGTGAGEHCTGDTAERGEERKKELSEKGCEEGEDCRTGKEDRGTGE